MPAVDPTGWPAWVQLVIIVGAISVALVGIGAFIRKFWAAISVLVARSNSLDELPKFIADTTASLAAQDAALAKHSRQLATVDKELNYNGETSAKDAIRRIELGVKGIYGRLDAADAVADTLREDLEVTRPQSIRKRTTKPKETP